MRWIRRIRHVPRRLRRVWAEALGRPSDFEQQVYAALVRRGDVVLDIGANVGDVALYLSNRVGAHGKVVAFEPVIPMFEAMRARLGRQAKSAGNVIPVPLGLSDSERTAAIHVPDGVFGLGSSAPAGTWATAQASSRIASFECTFTTLDAWLGTARLGPPALVKIDVEGAELFVLKGAGRLLKSECPPILVMEVFAPWERAFGYGPWEVFALLLEAGYACEFMCPGGLVPHRPSEATPFPDGYEHGYNVVAYPRDIDRRRLTRLQRLRRGGTGKILGMAPPPIPNVLNQPG